jgi:hypothetical protein
MGRREAVSPGSGGGSSGVAYDTKNPRRSKQPGRSQKMSPLTVLHKANMKTNGKLIILIYIAVISTITLIYIVREWIVSS